MGGFPRQAIQQRIQQRPGFLFSPQRQPGPAQLDQCWASYRKGRCQPARDAFSCAQVSSAAAVLLGDPQPHPRPFKYVGKIVLQAGRTFKRLGLFKRGMGFREVTAHGMQAGQQAQPHGKDLRKGPVFQQAQAFADLVFGFIQLVPFDEDFTPQQIDHAADVKTPAAALAHVSFILAD